MSDKNSKNVSKLDVDVGMWLCLVLRVGIRVRYMWS